MPVNHNVESRLSKAETEVESLSKDIGVLTSDVRSLASSVRAQGEQFDLQLRQLHVAVTAASAPRKTDWQVILFGIGLALSIGTAALSPMYSRLHDLGGVVEKLDVRFSEHAKLKLHPVGETRIDSLEYRIAENMKHLTHECQALEEDINATSRTQIPALSERLSVIEEKINRQNH